MHGHDVIAGAPAMSRSTRWLEGWLPPDKMKYGLTIVDRAQHQRRTTVHQYVGLDVALKDTSISVRLVVIIELIKTYRASLGRSGSTDWLGRQVGYRISR